MDVDERQKLVGELERGRKELLDAVDGLTDEAAARVPEAGRWSVLECVEHVATAEDYLFSQIAAAQPADGELLSRDREARILARGVDRSWKVSSPEAGLPHGRFGSLQEAVERFLASRERTMRFVANCEHDLRGKLTTHPIIGKANCYEMVLMMAIHPMRHAKQILEIRGAGDGNPIPH